MEQPIEPECKSIGEYILYKMDRTIAIIGLVALGLFALYKGGNESLQIAIAVAGVLGGYVGARASK